MKKFKPSILLIVLITALTGCGDGSIPTNINKPSTDTTPSDDLGWTFGETAQLAISGSQARRTLETLGTDLLLNVNEFENLSVNLEIQTISVLNPGQQQYYAGDLSIGWVANGEFQQVKARAETTMMQASEKDCSWWRGCTVLFTQSNKAKRHSFGKGASVRLIFEILDEWGADYDLMGGAFIFYGNIRGDEFLMDGSIHYLPPYCPNGGGWVNGIFYACAEKSLHMHCWLLRSGPYQCHTTDPSPSAGYNTYQVQHCKSGSRYDDNLNKYVCPSDKIISRNYTKIGTFRNFDFTNANTDYYGSISTSSSSRGLASTEDNKQYQIWMLYILCGTFICTIIITLVGYSKSGSKKNEKKV